MKRTANRLPSTAALLAGLYLGALAAYGQTFTDSSTAGPAIIHVFDLGSVIFEDFSTAGTARITAGVAASNDSFTGGFVFFRDNSSADHATITTFVGSNVEFHDESRAGNATLTAGNATIPSGAGNNGFIFFFGTSTADRATITVNPLGELEFAPAFGGGGTSSAGNSTINNSGIIRFNEGSTAQNAVITTSNGGVTNFFDESTGDNAAFITNAGGTVDISGLGVNVTGTTAGSIAGAGTYNLGSKELMVGSNNLSTEVSGLIEGIGGSLTKVGTGTLTLLGDNTYSGGTTIQEGTIAVGNLPGSQNEALGISTALGKGDVSLQGGTLRTTSLETGKPLEINVGRNYTQGPDGTLALGIGARPPALFDHVAVGGNASLAGTLVVSSLDKFSPVGGDAFLVLHTGGTILNGSKFSIQDQQFNTNNLQRVELYTKNGVVISYVEPEEEQ